MLGSLIFSANWLKKCNENFSLQCGASVSLFWQWEGHTNTLFVTLLARTQTTMLAHISHHRHQFFSIQTDIVGGNQLKQHCEDWGENVTSQAFVYSLISCILIFVFVVCIGNPVRIFPFPGFSFYFSHSTVYLLKLRTQAVFQGGRIVWQQEGKESRDAID